MVKIYLHQYGVETKKIKELHIQKAGEDGEYIWLRMITEDGEEIITGYFKEAQE